MKIQKTWCAMRISSSRIKHEDILKISTFQGLLITVTIWLLNTCIEQRTRVCACACERTHAWSLVSVYYF
jgi:hypothetical protein